MLFVLLIVTTVGLYSYIACRNLKQALLLLLAALPTYLVRIQIGPIPTTLLELLLLATVIVWLIHSRRALHLKKLTQGWHVAILLFVLAATVSAIVSPSHLAALGIWKAYIIEPILLFFVCRSTLKTAADVEQAFLALGASALVVSALGIFQRATGLFIPAPWDIERRITSVFDFPNAVGLFVGPIVTIAAVMLSRAKMHLNDRRTWFWIGVMLFGMVAIVFSQTEAAYVAIPSSLLIISFFSKRWRKVTIPLFIVLAIAAFALPITRQKLLLQDYSGQVRQTQWVETWQMLKAHPIFGSGLAGYEKVFAPYHVATWVEIFEYPHNILLNIWVELGLLGLLAFGWIVATVLRLFRGVLSEKPGKMSRTIGLACMAALLEMTIHGLVDVPYFKNDLSVLVWVLFAILSVAASRTVDQTTKT